jgi:hypothetical protein
MTDTKQITKTLKTMGKDNDVFLEGNKEYDHGKWDSNKSTKAKRNEHLQ